jgi:hypothetical protein
VQESHISIAPITCHLSHLTVFTADSEADYPETILKQKEPFQLRVTVAFGGPGAIALMPVGLTVRVDFFAEALGIGSKVELGKAVVATAKEVFTYTPTLKVAKPAAVGLVAEEIYHVSAVLRVGAPEPPALIAGFIEGLTIQIYQP